MTAIAAKDLDRCPRCWEPLKGAESCSVCARNAAPPVASWPEGAKKFLTLLILVDASITKIDLPEQDRYEWLLENAIHGRYLEGRLVPYAASAAVCYPEFVKLLERWKAAGSPTDFKAIARLRGAR